MEKITQIFKNLITFLFQLGMVGGAIVLIILGIKYAFEGRTQKTEQLKKLFIYVIVGLVLLVVAFFVPQMLKALLSKYKVNQ